MGDARVQAECFHPSRYIQDELDERGWTLDDLAIRMGGDFGINRVALDFYFEVGPTEPNLLLGDHTSRQLCVAFDVSPQLFLNLHAAWRDAYRSRAEGK